jgi:hypothetical protein
MLLHRCRAGCGGTARDDKSAQEFAIGVSKPGVVRGTLDPCAMSASSGAVVCQSGPGMRGRVSCPDACQLVV